MVFAQTQAVPTAAFYQIQKSTLARGLSSPQQRANFEPTRFIFAASDKFRPFCGLESPRASVVLHPIRWTSKRFPKFKIKN
jgi:hypothetical protein